MTAMIRGSIEHLRHLCRVNGRISNLTTLYLTFQCSEQVFINVLKYLVSLQELVLSIAHPSPSWQDFLESLAAKPSTTEWPALYQMGLIIMQLQEMELPSNLACQCPPASEIPEYTVSQRLF
jgi:hypothetical protein